MSTKSSFPETTPRRVLMTADTVGGVWTYALDLTRALEDYGVAVDLATMGAPLSPQQRDEADALANLTLHESNYKLEWMEDSWIDVQKAGDWLLWLERTLQPDVVHLNGYAHGALPWRTPVLMAGHSCVFSWWKAVKGTDAPSRMNHYWYEVARGLQGAQMVVAPTHAMMESLDHYYGPFAGTRVIPNGRRMDLFKSGGKEPFIFSAGRLWDEAKNIGALAAVAPRLEWPVYIAGEARHPDGGSVDYNNIHFLGHLNAHMLTRWYSNAAIYALPARYEPFGLSVLEAALSGCALVLGDIPSLRENWNGMALFVPPGDHEALASALESLIADPSRRRSLADRAHAHAREFTLRRMAQGYMDAYHELMNRHGHMAYDMVFQPGY